MINTLNISAWTVKIYTDDKDMKTVWTFIPLSLLYAETYQSERILLCRQGMELSKVSPASIAL